MKNLGNLALTLGNLFPEHSFVHLFAWMSSLCPKRRTSEELQAYYISTMGALDVYPCDGM